MTYVILYCDVCKRGSNLAKNAGIGAKDSEILNLKLSQSEMIVKEILENLRETKNSEISAKDFEIQNLKSEMSHSEMKDKEELENLRESSTPKKILSM